MRSTLVRSAAAALLLLCLCGATRAAADRYVALGDSYSAGLGTRTADPGSGGCARSPDAFPALLAARRPDTQLVFVACSGATTADVLTRQVGSLTPSTKLVSITIGGNDAGFSGVLTECAKPAWASDCAGRVRRAEAFVTGTLPGRLDAVFDQIRARSPSARVLVLDYPRLFDGQDCDAATFFSGDDEARLNAAADLMRSVESGRAAAHGFSFADVIGAFAGHAVCDRPAWLNGLSSPLRDSFHPNRAGQALGYLPAAQSVLG